ncbi:MAG: cytochrome c family protein [Pseudomonadota bacterium]
MRLRMFTAIAVAAAVFAAPALAEGDAKKGAKVFRKCKACHVVDEETNKVGPHLVGIIDRSIATAEGYKYSGAMIEFGADGKVWDVETLTLYLKSPKDLIKGTKMVFVGLKKDADLENIIAYLQDPASAE